MSVSLGFALSLGLPVPSQLTAAVLSPAHSYDSVNVWRTYGVGDPTPAVANSTFADMQALAYWLEASKMRSNLTGSLLGGPLLAAVSDALQAAALAATTTGNATSQASNRRPAGSSWGLTKSTVEED